MKFLTCGSSRTVPRFMAIAVLMLHEISGYWGGLVTDFVGTALTIGSLVMAVIGLIGAVGVPLP